MKKVTIVLGSPRLKGNTGILLEQVVRGLRDKGYDSEVFHLNALQIRGCQACDYCKRNEKPKCVVKDDMQTIYKSMEESEGLIIASPIYFAGVTAQIRLWSDRLWAYYTNQLTSRFPKGKKLGVLITQSNPNQGTFKSNIDEFKSIISMLGYDKAKSIIASDLYKGIKPIATERQVLLDEAYEFGRSIMD